MIKIMQTNASINFADYNISDQQIKHVVDGQQRLTSFSGLLNVLKGIIESDSSVSDVTQDFLYSTSTT